MQKDRFAVAKQLEDNLAVLEEALGYGVTFDLVFRRLRVANRQSCLVFFDGFIQMKQYSIIRHSDGSPWGFPDRDSRQDLCDWIPYFN